MTGLRRPLRTFRNIATLHLLVLAVFAFALLLRPVLASFGEMHELAHDPSGAHAHAMQSDAPTDAFKASDRGEDEAVVLHTLMHLAHCCGHTSLATPPSVPMLAAIAGPAAPWLGHRQAPATKPGNTPFRPPIAA